MQKKFSELPFYLIDLFRYRSIKNKLFWFQKFAKKDWVYGQNFGDYLSLIIVGEILKNKNLLNFNDDTTGRKLLGLGSILHFANNNDVVWGSGVNGKIDIDKYRFKQLDVRMVRGPLTKAFLNERNIEVKSDIFGDPALLIPRLFPELKYRPIKGRKIILPNLNELPKISKLVSKEFKLVSPIGYWKMIIAEILKSELVLTSSLHGLILSEIYEVPVRFLSPCGGETLFKYQDYLEGTGRKLEKTPNTFLDGIHEESGITFTKPVYSAEEMLNAFPYDFFV